ncbi:hypothetical protein BWQ96_01991 [Gracilariopsis chorda]|uniref:Uncharacterized protein n=1 Tax=Gracilariopsis chorda TaxID=448386 RepID=A0A2V3J2G9_9FLOR|nr:hypothetical protein BWQ96_01991 [Gracilariopsis chorda]|eukprot:PXF48302.1 hypothetical protein BWQ96_01991 [Gracilariopsis chorda]
MSDQTKPENSQGEGNSSVQAILRDLPSSDAFSAFEPTIATDAFKRYIPAPSDTARQIRIANEKNRCLIRALTARPFRSRKRSAPSISQPAPKRPRWIQLDREKKQLCLKVALTASCQHGEPGDALNRLKDGWAQNPRRKQSVNSEIRRILRERVPLWTKHELRQYLLKTGDNPNDMSVHDMRQAIREHLSDLA